MSVKSTCFKILVTTVAFLIAAFTALSGLTGSDFVCDHCGALGSEMDWCIPLTWIRVFHGDIDTVPTPFSTALTGLGLIKGGAPHHWVLAWTLGSRGEYLGVGHRFFLTVRSDRVAELIRAAHLAGDTAFCEQLIQCAFQRETSGELYQLAVSAAPGSFADTATYRVWLRDKTRDIQRFLHVNPPNQAMQRTPDHLYVYD